MKLKSYDFLLKVGDVIYGLVVLASYAAAGYIITHFMVKYW